MVDLIASGIAILIVIILYIYGFITEKNRLKELEELNKRYKNSHHKISYLSYEKSIMITDLYEKLVEADKNIAEYENTHKLFLKIFHKYDINYITEIDILREKEKCTIN
jgi:phosphoenolpyruvate synthase/pyruvate phosphate dikinase